MMFLMLIFHTYHYFRCYFIQRFMPLLILCHFYVTIVYDLTVWYSVTIVDFLNLLPLFLLFICSLISVFRKRFFLILNILTVGYDFDKFYSLSVCCSFAFFLLSLCLMLGSLLHIILWLFNWFCVSYALFFNCYICCFGCQLFKHFVDYKHFGLFD